MLYALNDSNLEVLGLATEDGAYVTDAQLTCTVTDASGNAVATIALSYLGAVSLGVWFKTNAPFQAATACMLAAKAHNFFNNVFQYALFAVTNNRVLFRCYNASNAIIGTVVTTATWGDNQWHHALGTYASAANTMQFFVDGQLVGAVNNLASKMATDGTAPLVIGGFGATISGCASFTGLIGEVRVYPFAASAAQAWQLFRRPYDAFLRRWPRHGFFPGLDRKATFASVDAAPRFAATAQATARFTAASSHGPNLDGEANQFPQ